MFAAAFLAATASASIAAPVTFTATPLQLPDDAYRAEGLSVSATGYAIGWVERYATQKPHAVRWDASGTPRYLDVVVPGANTLESRGYGVNDEGVAVGDAFVHGPQTFPSTAVRWTASGQATLPGVLTGPVYDLNNHDQMVGSVGNDAVRWESDGTMTTLGNPPDKIPALSATPIALSDRGSAVGSATLKGMMGGSSPVRWDASGQATVLRAPSGSSYIRGNAVGIDEDDTAVGTLTLRGLGARAIRWAPDGTPELLSNLAGATPTGTYAEGIADGLVVGRTWLHSHTVATLWDAEGIAYRLQDLTWGGWVLSDAFAIDANDESIRVLAKGRHAVETGGYDTLILLTATLDRPSAVPSPLAATAAAMLLLPMLGRRDRPKRAWRSATTSASTT